MKNRLTLSCTVLLACSGFLLGGGKAFGYAGEYGSVDQSSLTVSTHHVHLTRALAYCAGFAGRTDVRNPISPLLSPDPASPNAARDAEIIAIYDELTDQGTLDKDGSRWTNITPDWQYTPPTAEALGCPGLKMVFPILRSSVPDWLTPEMEGAFWEPSEGWFTNRFSPWATQFHFPSDDSHGNDLSLMYDFAKGTGTELRARTVYEFGDSNANLWSGSCHPATQRTTLNTGSVTPGSLAAVGTYLHSLGDKYSHGVCRDNWGTTPTPPWYYHTPVTALVDGCAFNSHSLEFGCPSSEWRAKFLRNVVDGGLDVFSKLLEFAGDRKLTPRLKSAGDHGQWLKRQLERYAILYENNFNPAAGGCRVSYTWALMKACDTAAATAPNVCMKDVEVANDGTCGASGQTTGCSEGISPQFPVTSACQPQPAQATAAAR